MSDLPIYTMDLVDDILTKYGQEPDGDFGFHAWMAAYYVSRAQMPSFCEHLEAILRTDERRQVRYIGHLFRFESHLDGLPFRHHYLEMFYGRPYQARISA